MKISVFLFQNHFNQDCLSQFSMVKQNEKLKERLMIDVEEILSKMNPNQKINYDRVMQKMVQDW